MLDCKICQLIHFDSDDGTYELPDSSEMTENAIDGCGWCQFFCEVAKKNDIDIHEDLNLKLFREDRDHSRVWLQIEGSDDQTWDIELMLCDCSGVEPALDKEYDEAKGRRLGRRIYGQAEGKDCLGLALDWLQRCREHHGGLCTTSSQNPLPTRLLYIGSQDNPAKDGVEVHDEAEEDNGLEEGKGGLGVEENSVGGVPCSEHKEDTNVVRLEKDSGREDEGEEKDIVRLVTTAGQLGDYVALSYVWGQTLALRCTERNIDKLKEGFPVERLPILMREAVTVARHLGFDWIWIDGLCIIQGNEDDWSREASKMAQVYGNSSLTISADLSDDVDTDLFWGRAVFTSPELRTQPGVCMQTTTPGWEQITDEPLYRRGWPFQERILSSRMLHYFTDQIAWECNTTVYLESHRGPYNKPGSHFHKSTLSGFFKHNLLADAHKSPEIEGDLRLDPINRIGCWSAIIQEVVFKDFTMRTDLLPAVSGLASALQVPEIGEYLAGIWEKYPGITMAWFMLYSQMPHGKPYKAPSWSWAWTEGQIVWHNEPFDFDSFEGEPEWRKWIHERSPRIVSHSIQPRAADMKGEVLEGSYIVIEGRCTSVWVLETPDRIFEPWETQNDDPECKKPDVKAHMDFRENNIDSQAFFDELAATQYETYDPHRTNKYLCLELHLNKSRVYTLALILESVPGVENAFKRVGLLAYKDIARVTRGRTWTTRTLELY